MRLTFKSIGALSTAFNMFPHTRFISFASVIALLWLSAEWAHLAIAADADATVAVAEKLSAATVTIRTLPARAASNYLSNSAPLANPNGDPAASGKSPDNNDQAGKTAAPAERTFTRRQSNPKRDNPAAQGNNATDPAGNPPAANYANDNSNLLNNLTYNSAILNNDSNDAVTVCSGVAVGKGLIVTFSGNAGNPSLNAGNLLGNSANLGNGNTVNTNESTIAGGNSAMPPQASRFRITLPDGQQAKATLRVVDHYSGLSLLDVPDANLPALELSTRAPRVGSTVMSAAASGIERPVVSRGIVSSIDRSLPGSDFPPLLQCDLHTTETSSGAALVDGDGKLVGIIVATSATGQASGWTFAVPARHVQRLLEAAAQGKSRIATVNGDNSSQVTVLERRRPSVGLTLGPGAKEGTVEVEHVVSGGAADRAGIKQGDLVLEAEGRKIRSAYQAVDVVLNRQPGEKLEIVVQRGDEQKTVQILLENAAEAVLAQQPGNYDNPQAQIGPQVSVRRDAQTNHIEIRNHRAGELNGNITQRAANGAQQYRAATNDDTATLRARLSTVEREAEALREEVTRLKKQLEASKK